MKPLRWHGVVTEKSTFMADDHTAFRAYMRSLVGDPVEVIVISRRPQSQKKRGYYRASMLPAFRAYLETRFRDLVEAYREHQGEFTLAAAHECLVRNVMNLPEDEERVSTRLDAMNDEEYGNFLFRVEGFLTWIQCDFPEAERDPVRRNEQRLRRPA